MSKIRIALIISGVLLLGLLICPRNPRVDPEMILDRVISRGRDTSWKATQVSSSLFYGTTIKTRQTVKRSFAVSDYTASLIKSNYIPLVESEDKIAGRDTWVLRLKPKIKHRPWKQLWVDKKTYFVLASRDWSARDVQKRSMRTVSISHRLAINNKLPYEREGVGFTNEWKTGRPHYLPEGFRIVRHPDPLNSDKRSVYSDGLYAISVIIRKQNNLRCKLDTPLDWGQGLIYISRRNSREIVVIADLLPTEIAKIAKSVPL